MGLCGALLPDVLAVWTSVGIFAGDLSAECFFCCLVPSTLVTFFLCGTLGIWTVGDGPGGVTVEWQATVHCLPHEGYFACDSHLPPPVFKCFINVFFAGDPGKNWWWVKMGSPLPAGESSQGGNLKVLNTLLCMCVGICVRTHPL